MDRRLVLLRTTLALGVIVAGCAADPPGQPDASSALRPGLLTGALETPDLLAAHYTLALGPDAWSASVQPARSSAAQPPQNLQYDLDLSRFLSPRVLEATQIRVDEGGDVVVGLRHRHPFPAPDLTQPATATNRADLGYTGRLLVLAQGPTQSFFGGEVQVDPDLVVAPDGFVRPGGLLRTLVPPPHNTFPYLLLVDEARDNRAGVSNGGRDTGSYTSGSGWQAANLGPQGVGWTGFDALHAGQAADLSLVLRRERVAAPVRLQLALLIKYTDPKGANDRDHRFPRATPTLSQFAYRMPYAALDASTITVDGEVALDDVDASVSVAVEVRDWDAAAAESADHDLSNEFDPGKIQPGAAGPPLLELHAPTLAETITLDPVGGIGHPAAPLRYEGLLPNTFAAGPGVHPGMLRAIDPEDGDEQAETYRFGLHPDTLAPDPGRALGVRTYQAVPITVRDTRPAVLSVAPAGPIGSVGGTVRFSGTTSRPVVGWAWEFGGGILPPQSTEESPEVALFNAGTYQGTVTVQNAAGASLPFTFEYTIGGPERAGWALTWGGEYHDHMHDVAVAPTGEIFLAGGLVAEPVSGAADLDPTAGTDLRVLNSIADAVVVRLGPRGEYRWGMAIGGDQDDGVRAGAEDQARAIVVDAARGALYVAGHYVGDPDFDPGPGTAGPATPSRAIWSFLARYDLDGTLHWVHGWGHSQSYEWENRAEMLAVDPAGSVYVGGRSVAGSDLDPGPGTAIVPPGQGFEPALYVSKFDSGGNYLWSRWWITEWSRAGLHAGSEGAAVVSSFRNTVDLNPGVGEDLRTVHGTSNAFLVQLDPGGGYAAGHTWGTPSGAVYAASVTRNAQNDFLITGSFIYLADFDPGPGEHLVTGFAEDGYLLALDQSAGFRWVEHWSPDAGETSTDTGRDVVVDAAGNPVVVGTIAPSWSQGTLRKYNPGGTPAWGRAWGGTGEVAPAALATIDATGLVLVGEFDGEADFGFGGPPDPREGSKDIFIVRLKSDGTR
ncbi:MAG TPA: PKD domain-containing protein [bacterium]|nr:PKD domain-containing protein [bacterium]